MDFLLASVVVITLATIYTSFGGYNNRATDLLYCISGLLAAIGLRKIYTTILVDSVENFDKWTPRYDGKEILPLWSGNGIGLTLYGDCMRYDPQTQSEVKYVFLIFFYLPILPLGCYRVQETGYASQSYKRSCTSYKIFGSERWRILEVICIYLRFLTGILLVIAVICVISAVVAALFD